MIGGEHDAAGVACGTKWAGRKDAAIDLGENEAVGTGPRKGSNRSRARKGGRSRADAGSEGGSSHGTQHGSEFHCEQV